MNLSRGCDVQPIFGHAAEAILYLKGRPISVGELKDLSRSFREEVEQALLELTMRYAQQESALVIQETAGRYCLQLKEGLTDLVQDLLPVDLSTAALRTLATIALKKRILQADLVELRGSGAYDHIKELLAQDFIERRRQSEGRSYWILPSRKSSTERSVLLDLPMDSNNLHKLKDRATHTDRQKQLFSLTVPTCWACSPSR